MIRRAAAGASGIAGRGEREAMIREAAYFRAERRGFAAGHELDDWLAAELEIDRWLETRGAPHRYARRSR